MLAAADYIESVILNPQAVDELLQEAEKVIGSLADFPTRFAIADDPVLRAWGIRFTNVKNYLVFYVVSESDHRVTVLRFLHMRRDWTAVLKRAFTEL